MQDLHRTMLDAGKYRSYVPAAVAILSSSTIIFENLSFAGVVLALVLGFAAITVALAQQTLP